MNSEPSQAILANIKQVLYPAIDETLLEEDVAQQLLKEQK